MKYRWRHIGIASFLGERAKEDRQMVYQITELPSAVAFARPFPLYGPKSGYAC